MSQHIIRRATALLASSALLGATLVAAAPGATALEPVLSPPTAVTGYGVNHGYAIDFDEPVNTTGLLGYTARLYRESDPTMATALRTKRITRVSDQAKAGSLRFVHLTPGERFFGSLTAEYVGGSSSAPVVTEVDQAYAPLPAVRNLRLRPGDRQITARWKAPLTTDLTGPVTGYIAVAARKGRIFPIDIRFTGADERRAVLKGLTNGRWYRVRVVAVAANDTGRATGAGARPQARPASPTSLVHTWKPGGRTELDWTAATSTHRAPVRGYLVFINGVLVKRLEGRMNTDYTVKGERPGRTYRYAIRAYNGASWSQALRSGPVTRP